MMPTVTHTYVLLELSREAYEEIAAKLKAAEYDHAFGSDGEIDMNGIAVIPNATPPECPVPPEGQLQCGTCGYTASESQYKHTCWTAIMLTAVLIMVVLIPVVLLIDKSLSMFK